MMVSGSKLTRRAYLVLAPLTVLLLSNVAHAAPPTAITTCAFVITTPGQYYLANDLLGCANSGIVIAASDVRLRLDGHTIQGSGHGDGIDVRNGVNTNILIQGPGTIAGFSAGVSLVDAEFSRVIDVTATGNQVGFFVARTPTGSSSHNVIQGNVATENSVIGISIVGSSENKIVNNLITNNGHVIGGDGIDLVGSNNNEVHGNIVTGHPSVGIYVFSSQNNIDGNVSLDNGFLDMLDRIPECDDNQWEGNRFETANQSCIQ